MFSIRPLVAQASGTEVVLPAATWSLPRLLSGRWVLRFGIPLIDL